MKTSGAILILCAFLLGTPSWGQTAAGTSPAVRPPPHGFDRPDPDRLVQERQVGETVIRMFLSRPSDKLWRSPRDDTVFTVGSTTACYFYPQRPDSTSVVLCSESNMFDLRNSHPIRVHVGGLEPDTVYYYRVNDSREYVRFRTPPPRGQFSPYQISVVTDSQGPYDTDGRKDRHVLGTFEKANVASAYGFNITTDSMRRMVQPDLSLHCGDVIEDARYWIQWEKEMFGDLKYYLTQAPCVPALGNHEYEDARWWRFFDLPAPPQDDNGSTGAYFAFDWGDTLIVSLDSNGNYYPRLDVDELPDEVQYEVTDDVIAAVGPHVDPRLLAPLESIKGRRYLRLDFLRTLHRLAVPATASRVIRTAAAVATGEKSAARIVRADPDPRFCDLDVLYHRQGLDKMVRWLRETLAANQDRRYIFVIQHHPLLYGGAGATGMHAILEEFGVTATFSGHWHGFAHSAKNGIHYLQAGVLSDNVFSGLGGGGPHFRFHRHGPAYLLLTVDADQALIQAISRANEVFYEITLDRRTRSEDGQAAVDAAPQPEAVAP